MKIICIGRNYAEHAKELGNTVPESPVIFLKPKSAIISPKHSITIPSFTQDFQYELELVVKISKNGKNIHFTQANEYYNEITVGIDFTARDLQTALKSKGLPWEKAKAFDDSALVGEFISIADLNILDIDFSMTNNGEIIQKGNSKEMIFSVNKLIEEISRYFTLNIGDLIYTGTPAGVGTCISGDKYIGFINNQPLFEIGID